MRLRNVFPLLLIAMMTGVLYVAALGLAAALRVQDLAQYWSAAHLATENPFSVEAVSRFEASYGYSTNPPPMVMRNPPWSLVFVLPFRYMSYRQAFAFWALLSVVIVAGCARAVWGLVNPVPSLAPAFLSLIYGPTVVLLMLGQVTVLVLLGVTLFLVAVERRNDWLAGASLLLILVKPHVAFLFLLAVLLWALSRKKWVIFLSSVLALATTSIAVLAINPHIYTQYMEYARRFAQETVPYPNFGGMLYIASGRHALAFIPQLIATAWLLYYWRKHRAHWDWNTDGMTVLLVSVAFSYFSYPYDEIIMIPALIAAYAVGNRRIFLAGFVFANAGYALYISNVAGRFGFQYMFLWWTATAWLLTCILARKVRPGSQSPTLPESAKDDSLLTIPETNGAARI
jgi:hypothetical protein